MIRQFSEALRTRLINRVKFVVERLLLRGALYRLGVIIAVIAGVAVGGGLVVYLFTDQFQHPGQAVWWAFLRLTDPGYLGDDEGLLVRTVSTVVTVTGYVLFLGALIAIMTQWLDQTIERLQLGLTPIAENDHVLVLGWTSRTLTLLRELMLSEERVERFLRVLGARRLNVAVLAETVDEALVQQLRQRLGPYWKRDSIILRSGSPLRMEHLLRADFLHASAILLPAPDSEPGSPVDPDSETVKTLVSIDGACREARSSEPPLIVAEIADAAKLRVARDAYRGPMELVPSDAMIGRLLVQVMRHPGVSAIYDELLSHERGNEIYLRPVDETLAGRPFGAALEAFEYAIPLGVAVAAGGDASAGAARVELNPPAGRALQAGEQLVLLSWSYADSAPLAKLPAPAAAATDGGSATAPVAEPRAARSRRVLIVGWNRRTPALLRELDSYQHEEFEVDVLSLMPADERRLRCQRAGFRPQRIRLGHVEADFTAPSDMRAQDPDEYDVILLQTSDWRVSGDQADANTILGYLILEEILRAAPGRPHVLAEVSDPLSEAMFSGRPVETVVTPSIPAHLLVQVALRPALSEVFATLFGADGPELHFRAPGHFGLREGEAISFRDLQRRVGETGEIAIGVERLGYDGRLELRMNPHKHERRQLDPDGRILVLGPG